MLPLKQILFMTITFGTLLGATSIYAQTMPQRQPLIRFFQQNQNCIPSTSGEPYYTVIETRNISDAGNFQSYCVVRGLWVEKKNRFKLLFPFWKFSHEKLFHFYILAGGLNILLCRALPTTIFLLETVAPLVIVEGLGLQDGMAWWNELVDRILPKPSLVYIRKRISEEQLEI